MAPNQWARTKRDQAQTLKLTLKQRIPSCLYRYLEGLGIEQNVGVAVRYQLQYNECTVLGIPEDPLQLGSTKRGHVVNGELQKLDTILQQTVPVRRLDGSRLNLLAKQQATVHWTAENMSHQCTKGRRTHGVQTLFQSKLAHFVED